MPGDYDGNGAVDLADYTRWRDKLGSAATLFADTTPGSVTAADYGVWKAHFGQSSGSGNLSNAVVPEPATAMMLLIVAAVGCCLREGGCAYKVPKTH